VRFICYASFCKGQKARAVSSL